MTKDFAIKEAIRRAKELGKEIHVLINRNSVNDANAYLVSAKDHSLTGNVLLHIATVDAQGIREIADATKHRTEYTRHDDTMAEALAVAFKHGYRISSSYKPGDTFHGAFGAADACGYDADDLARACFVTGYLHGLDANAVVTTADNVIIRIEKKAR